jgi:hypothetical protein
MMPRMLRGAIKERVLPCLLSAALALGVTQRPCFALPPLPNTNGNGPKPQAPKPQAPKPGAWKPPNKGGKTAPHAPYQRPAAPLAFLPSISRVHIQVGKDRVLVVTDVRLPRGDYKSGSLALYAAMSAAGYPLAMDAKLFAAADGELDLPLEPERRNLGEALHIDLAPKAPVSANALLGSTMMRGAVVRIAEDAFKKALAPGNMAVLQVRALQAMPELDAAGARSLVLPLGQVAGQPLSLARVDVVGIEGVVVRSAFAQLCSPTSPARPLFLSNREGLLRDASEYEAVTPVLATRQPDDALCIRWDAAATSLGAPKEVPKDSGRDGDKNGGKDPRTSQLGAFQAP